MTVQTAEGTPTTLVTPKAPHNRRSVRLIELAIKALRNLKVRQDAEHAATEDSREDRGLVFPNTHGGPIDYANLTERSFNPLLRLSHPQVDKRVRETSSTSEVAPSCAACSNLHGYY